MFVGAYADTDICYQQFPGQYKNSLKTAILFYVFVTFWPIATDGSFCSVLQAYIHIQCTYTSRYNVCGILRTLYGNIPIRCTYADEYDVRIKLPRNVRFCKKKVEKIYITTVRQVQRGHKKEGTY